MHSVEDHVPSVKPSATKTIQKTVTLPPREQQKEKEMPERKDTGLRAKANRDPELQSGVVPPAKAAEADVVDSPQRRFLRAPFTPTSSPPPHPCRGHDGFPLLAAFVSELATQVNYLMNRPRHISRLRRLTPSSCRHPSSTVHCKFFSHDPVHTSRQTMMLHPATKT
jgi:hypothetical protein